LGNSSIDMVMIFVSSATSIEETGCIGIESDAYFTRLQVVVVVAVVSIVEAVVVVVVVITESVEE
jgi:hypothetical protein